MTADFSSETVQLRRQWGNISKVQEGRNKGRRETGKEGGGEGGRERGREGEKGRKEIRQ